MPTVALVSTISMFALLASMLGVFYLAVALLTLARWRRRRPAACAATPTIPDPWWEAARRMSM